MSTVSTAHSAAEDWHVPVSAAADRHAECNRRTARLHRSLAAPLLVAVRRWMAERARNRLIVELESLDERVLRDIGLTRTDLRVAILHLDELQTTGARQDKEYLP